MSGRSTAATTAAWRSFAGRSGSWTSAATALRSVSASEPLSGGGGAASDSCRSSAVSVAPGARTAAR